MNTPENEFKVNISKLPTESSKPLLLLIKRIRKELNQTDELNFSFSNAEKNYTGFIKIDKNNESVESSIDNPQHVIHIKNHLEWELLRILRMAANGTVKIKSTRERVIPKSREKLLLPSSKEL